MSEPDLKIDAPGVAERIPAPELPYLPPTPKGPIAPIGLIGCGAIAAYHLDAYAGAGYPVVALCDIDEEQARERKEKYYPDADTYVDYRDVLARADIGVVDIATHPGVRAPIIEAALNAGKHVLSQKPFVLDLNVGERLADLADEKGLRLAVNQNGRWAPHFSYIRHAVATGLIGEVSAAHFAVHWDHSWTHGTPFDDIPHMILYDFGIHWFDMLSCLFPDEVPKSVFATTAHAEGQTNNAPLLAQVLLEFENAQASLLFDAATPVGALDTTCVTGTRGTITSYGPDLSHQSVRLHTESGVAEPELEGEWFKNGFLGTMSELLCAIEDGREPSNGAHDNLNGLAMCFAAMASADTRKPQCPGTIRRGG